ncbi:MAG: hypothetical protein WCD62_14095 [Pseudolabrys sp.]
MTAPTPKAVRPIAASIVALPVMIVPENLPLARPERDPTRDRAEAAEDRNRDQILHEAQPAGRICRQFANGIGAERLDSDRDAGQEKTPPAQSNTHNGPCRFDGPPGIGNRPAPTAMKYRPAAAAIVA